MMAMDKRDWFPVSFSSLRVGASVKVFVAAIEVFVALAPGGTVARTTVTIFVWTTVTTTGVWLGSAVRIAEGVMEGVDINKDVAVGDTVEEIEAMAARAVRDGRRRLIKNNTTGIIFDNFMIRKFYRCVFLETELYINFPP